MLRTHREALWEVRREMVAIRADYREVLNRERRVRQDVAGYMKVHTAPAYRGQHRAALEVARRLAREGLEARRKALQENAWLLKVVALYEHLQQMRAQRDRARAERRAQVRPATAQPAVAQT